MIYLIIAKLILISKIFNYIKSIYILVMSNQDRDYNIDTLNIKQKEKLGEDLIDSGKAKFIDELISVNKLT